MLEKYSPDQRMQYGLEGGVLEAMGTLSDLHSLSV